MTGLVAAGRRRRRLGGQLATEVRLLARHGVVASVGVVTAVWAGLLVALPPTLRAGLAAPALYLDAAIVGLLFVGGTVLIERRQGVLEALAVSPLPVGAYVTARVASLTTLATAAVVVIALVALPAVAYGPLVAAVALASPPVLLVALVVAARSATITGYVFGLQAPLVPAAAPLLAAAGWLPEPLAWLVPLHGPFRLLEHAVGQRHLSLTAGVLGAVWALVATAVLWRLAVRQVRVRLWQAGGGR